MAIRIKLWADYGSYPIWGVDEIDNIAPEELPLRQETIDRLNAWQDAYDQTLNQDYPPLSGFPTLQAERNFKREAINLWKKLRLELAPDYEVFYQNGSQIKKNPPQGEGYGNRSLANYWFPDHEVVYQNGSQVTENPKNMPRKRKKQRKKQRKMSVTVPGGGAFGEILKTLVLKTLV